VHTTLLRVFHLYTFALVLHVSTSVMSALVAQYVQYLAELFLSRDTMGLRDAIPFDSTSPVHQQLIPTLQSVSSTRTPAPREAKF
jgi:hypothetical protein